MSDKSIAQKLFIKEGSYVLFMNAPENYGEILGELPKDVNLLKKIDGSIDLVQYFVTTKKDLVKELPKLKRGLKKDGFLWVTYPKNSKMPKLNEKISKTGEVTVCDINHENITEYASSIGLEGVAVISVDDTWSAMRLKIV